MQAARGFLQTLAGLRHAGNPLGWKIRVRTLAHELLKRPSRALKSAPAQGAHEGEERARLIGRSGDLTRRKKPIEFVFGDCAAEPAQQQLGSARKRDLADRNSQRKLQEICGAKGILAGGQIAVERALNFAAARARILRDDEQSRLRIRRELRLRPECTCNQFGGRIRGGVEMNLRRRCAERCIAHAITIAPGGEECLLRRQSAVEAGQQKGRTLRGVSFQRLIKLQRKTRPADQLPVAADLVERGEPGAKGPGVLVPSAARRISEKLRGVSAKQMMRLHCERGQSIGSANERDGDRRGFSDDARPQRLLLKVAEHHSTVKSALIPGVANESLPVENARRGPCGEPFPAARAMKPSSEGACGALAGGYYDSAVAQPVIDRWQFNAHSSRFVVRSWQSYAQGYRRRGWLPGMAAIGSLRTEN